MAKPKVVSRLLYTNIHVHTLAGAYIHAHPLVHTHV